MGKPVSKSLALDEVEVRDERAGNCQTQRGIHVIRRGRSQVFRRQKTDLVRNEDEEDLQTYQRAALQHVYPYEDAYSHPLSLTRISRKLLLN